MGIGSLWHWLIVLAIVLILFGRGRISEMMGDFGKGISSFKKGLNETEETAAKAARIEPPAAPVETAAPAPAEKTDSTGA
ncbi:twin-arginine translocase TatA/TatE family subunit [Porphyrobacter sp. CACIAM 03H1]|jgi:sec-independent protein translocase protein TatA|uniref:twin-arginine translocase TatA/TatE family subunit n=1 Tax=Porphyrobacter sp. CACIAM 03H1 TaxID=2003315 RepID=UPI000B5A28DD|nr:twin-arginine translocase TatA/TatE family subunit [Porphyrobacter sp. CACIAM 03H1]ASJ90580.1 twin-arginine translocase TatA/TatE family subunit [Porphyrobacter sp. CACIAM 03H1]